MPAVAEWLVCCIITMNIPTLWAEKAEIDEMVYRLYGLTDEKRQIVEKSWITQLVTIDYLLIKT
ncbi:MAG: hypothetical protein LC658_02560 [Bacteroidales bacterium]|nr:hypothetical protein [Bacteroidales bacterium]